MKSILIQLPEIKGFVFLVLFFLSIFVTRVSFYFRINYKIIRYSLGGVYN